MFRRGWLPVLFFACANDAPHHENDIVAQLDSEVVEGLGENTDAREDADIELGDDLSAVQETDVGEDSDTMADSVDTLGERVPRHLSGVIMREDRAVDVTRSTLLEVAIVPVVALEVAAWSDEVMVASAVTDAAGAFSMDVVLSREARLELRWQAFEDGLAVLDSEGVGLPPREGIPVRASRAWAWSATPVAGDDFGTITIDEAAGAGALAIFEHARAVRTRVEALFDVADGEADRLSSLAILWSPTRTPPCLSCYLPTGWGPTLWTTPTGEVVLDRAIFLSGAETAPHHFTPSLVLHELGHWVMDGYSRFPVVNGGHGWADRLAPPLAWSEGFATFFAQWFLSREALDSRFFTVQAGIEYWVDLEAVGLDADAATSLELSFPLPTEAGGPTQTINEAVVAAILWDLWDPANDDAVALGDEVVLAIAAMGDRGVAGPDLLDLLDAAACLQELAAFGDWSSALAGFPWDASPACP